MPLFENNVVYTQSIFDNLLKDNFTNISLAKQEIIAHNILSDSLLNKSIRTIVNKEHPGNDSTLTPTLSQFLNQDEMQNLKQMLDNADVLLIPSGILTTD